MREGGDSDGPAQPCEPDPEGCPPDPPDLQSGPMEAFVFPDLIKSKPDPVSALCQTLGEREERDVVFPRLHQILASSRVRTWPDPGGIQPRLASGRPAARS